MIQPQDSRSFNDQCFLASILHWSFRMCPHTGWPYTLEELYRLADEHFPQWDWKRIVRYRWVKS